MPQIGPGKLVAVYSRAHTVGSLLIRAGTASVWSHCGLLTPDDTVIDSTFKTGVREIGFEAWKAQYSYWRALEICKVPDPQRGIAWARTQIGKPYDWKWLLSFPFRRNWEDEDAWGCSEFLEYILVESRRRRFRSFVHRITPSASYAVE